MTDVERLRSLYDAQLRSEGEILPAGTHVESDGPVLRLVGGFRGFIAAPADLGPPGPALDALVRRQRDYFAARGEVVEWKTRGHDRPPELIGILQAAGFVPEPTETVLIGTTARIAADAPVAPAEGAAMRRTDDADDMARIADMESRIWDADRSWLAADLTARVGAGAVTVFVVEAGDEVVAAGWIAWTPGTDFAGLWGGSTMPAWRRRGLYRALVSARAAVALDRGVAHLQVDASDESRPILERLGFVVVTTTTPYVWTPDA